MFHARNDIERLNERKRNINTITAGVMRRPKAKKPTESKNAGVVTLEL